MRIQIVSHLYNDGLPELGLASIPHTYLGSLEQTGLASYDIHYLDKFFIEHGTLAEAELIEKCSATRPDFLLVTWLFSKPHLNMRASTFQIIREKLGIPIVLSIHDSARPWEIQVGELLYSYADLIYCLDGTLFYQEFAREKEKYISTFMPLDTRRFLTGSRNRDYDVSFLGRVYNERLVFLNHLAQNGIKVVVGGWTGEAEKVPLDLYAETLLRSKMTINTSRTGNGDTLKWRAMEATLCGTLLLEFADGTTKRFFEPYVDYVPFENENDLLDKVRYYLAVEAERSKIAESGYRKAWEHYTGVVWWNNLFQELRTRNVLKV